MKMECRSFVVSTWLSRKPPSNALGSAVVMALLLLVGAALSLLFSGEEWMSATKNAVFVDHQWWRVWTSLFVHADLGHLLSNALLLLPLTWLLSGYFGRVVIPVLALLQGGVVNLIVLARMPDQVALIGISGVVYWMGAVWLTLYLLIDTRVTRRRRWAHAAVLAVVLFAPEKFLPGVSYLSHLVGFLLGIVSGLLIFLLQRQKIQAAEICQPEAGAEEASDKEWLSYQKVELL